MYRVPMLVGELKQLYNVYRLDLKTLQLRSLLLLLLLSLLLTLRLSVFFFFRKSNAHTHILDWCAFVLDGVKIVGYKRTNGRTSKTFLGVACISWLEQPDGAKDKVNTRVQQLKAALTLL